MLWRRAPRYFSTSSAAHPISPGATLHLRFGWALETDCSMDWLLECHGPLDWHRRRSLDPGLSRPLDEVPLCWPREQLLDRDLDLDRLAHCDESRLFTPVAAERLFERELCSEMAPGISAARRGTLCSTGVRAPRAFLHRGGAPAVVFSKLSWREIIAAHNNSRTVQRIGSAGGTKGASCPADSNSALWLFAQAREA
ncbi:hypothetical protein MRX96_042088 [Rhipicephalus microplus]